MPLTDISNILCYDENFDKKKRFKNSIAYTGSEKKDER